MKTSSALLITMALATTEMAYAAGCWSEKLGYACCTYTNEVIVTDSDGDWGVEFNRWCGIVNLPVSNAANCWAAPLGYPCCETTDEVLYTDEDGPWSIENFEWCGIVDDTTATNTQPAVEPPAVKPPAVKPPAVEPPAVEPPAVEPPVEEPEEEETPVEEQPPPTPLPERPQKLGNVDITTNVKQEYASNFNEGKFEGFGTSFCWWANRIGYSDVLAEKAATAFYDKEEGLGLNIIRYNIGGGDDPTHDHITRTDSNMPGFAINPQNNGGNYSWEYDWNSDANQRNALFKAIEKNKDEIIVEGFSNSPPYFMTNSGCSSGNFDPGKNNLKDDAYPAFAKYLADVAEHFKTEWGLTFQSMTPLNEPNTPFWGAGSPKQEGCHFDDGEAESKIIVELRKALDERGLKEIQLSGTDETSIDTQITSYNKLSNEAKNAITRIDTHTYGGSKRDELRRLAEDAKKNLWMSEVDGKGAEGTNAGEMSSALWLANRIITDLNNLRASAWILWQVIDNHISKDGMNGKKDSGMVNTQDGFWGISVADHDKNEIILTQKYYGFGQFSRYIRPGYTLIGCYNNSIAFYDSAGI